MKNGLLFCLGLMLGISHVFAAETIMKTLAPLKTERHGMALSSSKVRGTNAQEMLEDYAKRIKEFEEGYTVSTRLSADQMPEADDGQDVVGLTKIVDVLHLITDPAGSDDSAPAESRRRANEVRDILFKVRDLGGLIGVESHSWSTCGVSFPGVIVLDVKKKEVISISPANTDC